MARNPERTGYVPAADLDLATKKYVDDNSGGAADIALLQAQIRALSAGTGVAIPGATDYGNTGGTGDRRAFITATCSPGFLLGAPGEDIMHLINGNYSDVDTVSASGGGVSGKFIKFAFASPVFIDEISFFMGPGTNGFFKWRGSNDDSTWSDLTGSIENTTPGGTGSSGMTNPGVFDLSGNFYSWKYYQMLGVSGTFGATYLIETTFKIYGL